MIGYYLSYGKWKMLYVSHNLLGLLSRDRGPDNSSIDRFVFDFDPSFITTLDAMIRKNGFGYLEKTGWKKKPFEADDEFLERLRARCSEGRIGLAKRVGKVLFYDAINRLEFAPV